MKKGQNRNYQKDAFQTGIGSNSVNSAIDVVRGWSKGGNSKLDRLNVCRKKKKRK